MTTEFARSADELNQVIAAIRERTPTDFIASMFDGRRLTLRGGRASSQWCDLEIVFNGVAYMALPLEVDQATLRLGGEAARRRVKQYFDMLDEDLVVFEIVEQPWINPDGSTTEPVIHVVAAEGLLLHVPATEQGAGTSGTAGAPL